MPDGQIIRGYTLHNIFTWKEVVVYLYELDIIDRDRFRELLGIEEKSYNERVHMGAWFSALEERFYSLPDDFLACKEAEILNDFGDC